MAWELTSTGAWVAQNAHRFGFIMTFPRGAEDVTCSSYEPWHYRYFGRALARKIHRSGLRTREFLFAMSRDRAA